MTAALESASKYNAELLIQLANKENMIVELEEKLACQQRDTERVLVEKEIERNHANDTEKELEGVYSALQTNKATYVQRLDQANSEIQKAAMAQVKIVMKGVMKGERCAMLHQWSANAFAAKQAKQSDEHKAKEQGLQQQANDIKQKAAMAQVKIVMKGVMKGERCAMLHKWSASAIAHKQQKAAQLSSLRESKLLEAYNAQRDEKVQQRNKTEQQGKLLQELEQETKDVRGKALVARVKVRMKGMLQGATGVMLNQWNANMVFAKQAKLAKKLQKQKIHAEVDVAGLKEMLEESEAETDMVMQELEASKSRERQLQALLEKSQGA